MIINFMYKNIRKIIIQIIIIIFIKLRLKNTIKYNIEYNEEIINKLINKFKPKEIIENKLNIKKEELIMKNKIDFCTFDYFNLLNKNKNKLKEIIKLYGVGTCGPPSFYGTLDLHIKLENIICLLLNKPICVLYSNHFTSINSLISCFINKLDIIFFHSEASISLLRGIYLTKAKSIKYCNLRDLEKLLKIYSIRRYYVYITDEILGRYINLNYLKKLKLKYNFHLFIDLSETFPMNLNEFRNYDIGDFLIGNFKILSSIGSFICGPSFQRLMSPSLCFSASIPAYLISNIIINLQRFLIFPICKQKYFINYFNLLIKEKNINYFIFKSDLPFFFIQRKDLRDYKKEYNKLLIIKDILKNKGFLIQVINNPIPRILICLKIHLTENEVKSFLLHLSICLL